MTVLYVSLVALFLLWGYSFRANQKLKKQLDEEKRDNL